MNPVGQGRTADVFQLADDKIIKLFRKNFSKEAISREFSASCFVYSLGLQTPKPVELTTLDGRDGIIFQRLSGRTLLKWMAKQPWLIRRQSRTLAKLHAQMHACAVPGDSLPSQKDVLSANIKAAAQLSDSEKTVILAYLEGLPEQRMLCHGDFHPDNVLVDGGFWTIDWMTAVSGSPAADAARSVLLFRYGSLPEGASPAVKILIQYLRKRMNKYYVAEYLRLSGLSYSDLDRWILPVAAARLTDWIPSEELEQLAAEVRLRLSAIKNK